MVYYVYILTNRTHTTVYVGVTRNLLRRVDEHRRHVYPDSFTAKYRLHELVYFEPFSDIRDAIAREKQLKGWNRRRKNALVESKNPTWRDLFPLILKDEIQVGEVFPEYWNDEGQDGGA